MNLLGNIGAGGYGGYVAQGTSRLAVNKGVANMRFGVFACAACTVLLPAVLQAQTYSRTTAAPTESVIRPAPSDVWRNYVTVPDGPCGYPMGVQADCYNGCGCGHCCCFRPLVFLRRVGRMLDCLLPCNLCCRGCGGGCGGCGGGGMHGCLLGGRTWGHCGMCCGGPMGGGYGAGAPGGGYGGGALGGGCGGNPCGSAFAPTYGGHCTGCSSVVPGAGETIIEEQALPPASAARPSEVRSTRTYRTQPSRYQEPSASNTSKQSVLRRVSAEQEVSEPGPLHIDLQRAKPIVRSQSPDAVSDLDIPVNPLRK